MHSPRVLQLFWRILNATVPTFLIAVVTVQLITKYWPSARIAGITVASIAWVLWALAGSTYCVQGRENRVTVALTASVWFIVIGAAIVAVGEFTGRLWGDARLLLDFAGLYYLALNLIAGVKFKFQELQLEADVQSPSKSAENDREQVRKYMHPYT